MALTKGVGTEVRVSIAVTLTPHLNSRLDFAHAVFKRLFQFPVKKLRHLEFRERPFPPIGQGFLPRFFWKPKNE